MRTGHGTPTKGMADGVLFMTLEDGTGQVDVIVWPGLGRKRSAPRCWPSTACGRPKVRCGQTRRRDRVAQCVTNDVTGILLTGHHQGKSRVIRQRIPSLFQAAIAPRDDARTTCTRSFLSIVQLTKKPSFTSSSSAFFKFARKWNNSFVCEPH